MTDSAKTKILAVVGATASGKSSLAIELAKAIDGEIISCDSMQVYQKMNIGTAKITHAEMQGIPHHLIDILPPVYDFSSAEYVIRAKEAIAKIVAKGRTPIICGGTGLYFDALTSNTKFSSVGKDEAYRAKLETKDIDTCHQMLAEIDPISAENIHKNNKKRVIRALEIYHVSGRTKTEWDADSRIHGCDFSVKTIGLYYENRELLYQKINDRVKKMFADGLVDEVRELDGESFRGSIAALGIGYKEILEYLDQKVTLQEAEEAIAQNTRNYAKRQITWFKRNKNIEWFALDDGINDQTYRAILSSVKEFLED